MLRTIRIGMIGAGGNAQAHAEALEQAEAKLLGVMDIKRDRAEAMANKYNAACATTDLKKLLAIDDLDAVIITTPNAYHARQSIAALRAGKHVLCEKPMATTVAQARRMVAEAKKARRFLTIGYCMRFMTVSQLAHEKTTGGRLGRINYVEARWLRRRGVPYWGSWFCTKKLSGGGPLIDLGCHLLDMGRWLLGWPKILRVCGTVNRHLAHKAYPKLKYDVEDFASALIRFANGVSMLLQVSWAGNIPSDMEGPTVLVTGDKAGCRLNYARDTVELFHHEGQTPADTTYQLPPPNQFTAQLVHFCHCIRKGRKPLVQPEQSLQVQETLAAIYKSAALGREVSL